MFDTNNLFLRHFHPRSTCIKWHSAQLSAAESAKTIFILSTYANCSMQEVAEAAPHGIKWFQMATHRDRSCTIHFVRRAEQAGFKAIVLTVDNPIVPKSKGSKMDKVISNTRWNKSVAFTFYTIPFVEASIPAILINWKNIDADKRTNYWPSKPDNK